MKKILKEKKKLIIIIIILCILAIVGLAIYKKSKRNYDAYLELDLKNSNIKAIYSPNNNQKVELFVGNTVSLSKSFSNNKNVDYKYIIENEDIISVENDKIIAKKEGDTNIYLKTKDGVKSNVINVVVSEEDYESSSE